MTSNDAQVSITTLLRRGPAPYSTIKRQCFADNIRGCNPSDPALGNDHRAYGPVLDALDYMMKTKRIGRVQMSGVSLFRITEP